MSKTKFVIAGLVIVATVGYLIVSSTGSSARLFITVKELQEMGEEAVGRDLTLSGAVLGETIVYDPNLPRVTFTLIQVPGDIKEVEQAGGFAAVIQAAIHDPDAPRVEVVYEDVKPERLGDKVQAIIRGQLAKDGRFYAVEVLFKCPARYEDEAPGQTGDGS